MDVGNSSLRRKDYNLLILDVIDSEVQKSKKSLFRLRSWEDLVKRLNISELNHYPVVNDLESLIIDLRSFFNEKYSYDLRFLQGLINYGLIPDSINWFEESKETYEKILKRLSKDSNETLKIEEK